MKYFLSLIIVSVLIISCESKKENSKNSISSKDSSVVDSSAVETAVNKDSCTDGIYIKYAHIYNNFIIVHQGYILSENIQFMKAAKENESKEAVAELYKILESQTQSSLDSINKLCPFNGNVEYKNAAIELYKFYQKVWIDYKELLGSETKAKRIKILDKMKIRFNNVYSIEEKKLEESFNMAHSNFANEYKLHVRSTPLHDELDSLLYLK